MLLLKCDPQTWGQGDKMFIIMFVGIIIFFVLMVSSSAINSAKAELAKKEMEEQKRIEKIREKGRSIREKKFSNRKSSKKIRP